MVPPGLGGLGSGWPLHRRLDRVLARRQPAGRRSRIEITMNRFLGRPDSLLFYIPLAALCWAGIDSGFLFGVVLLGLCLLDRVVDPSGVFMTR
ncbi:hypothetical protein BJX64DRAFT_267488 [Aspergillus heterothallicus]